MTRAFAVLIRLSLVVLVAVGIVAVVIGHWGGAAIGPPPATLREWAPAHERILDGALFAERPETSRLLDPDTGLVDLLEVPNTQSIDMLSISPWRGVDGQHHLIGRWRGDRGDERLRTGGALGLLRLTFPEGRVLDRIAFDAVPVSPPCWLPDKSDRVVFAAGDGQLYLLDLQAAGVPEDGVMVGRPRPIRWETDRPPSDMLHIRQPCWPGDRALGGRLVAVVYVRQPGQAGRSRLRSELWWLQLTPDCKAIAAAGRLIIPGEPDGAMTIGGEYAPSVGMTPDGVPILAYLVDSEGGEGTFELRTATIGFEGEPGGDPAGRIPRVEAATTRPMASVNLMATPVFSTDARWLYVPIRARDGKGSGVARFAVSPDRLRDVPTVRSETVPDGHTRPALGPLPAGRSPLS
jgi:hypothetical protein